MVHERVTGHECLLLLSVRFEVDEVALVIPCTTLAGEHPVRQLYLLSDRFFLEVET
jgi:hypothetical protein